MHPRPPITILLSLITLTLLSCAFLSQILPVGSISPSDTATANLSEASFSPIPSTTSIPAATIEPTIQPVAAPSLDATSASLSVGKLSGVAFHDLDGDGQKNENEPSVPNLRICLGSLDSPSCTISDEQGGYTLSGLPLGLAHLYLQSPQQDDPVAAFRYLNHFQTWETIPAYQIDVHWVPKQELPRTSLLVIDKPQPVDVSSDTKLDLALTQGYLTDIFRCGERERLDILTFQAFDLDPAEGAVRHYYETQSRTMENNQAVMFGDNHFAIDWGNTNLHIIGIPLYAPANAIVVFAGLGETWNGICSVVNLVHPETGDSSGLVHLDTVLVRERQEVLRGQLLGTLGMNCTTWPHVHFYFKPGYDQQTGIWVGRDPYRDIADPDSTTYWTIDNQPQCPAFLGLGN